MCSRLNGSNECQQYALGNVRVSVTYMPEFDYSLTSCGLIVIVSSLYLAMSKNLLTF